MILAYEYGDNKIKDSEKKINAKLKYNKFGAYDKDNGISFFYCR